MFKLLTKTEDADRTIWVYSRDGGKTRVVWEGPVHGDPPGDLALMRAEREQHHPEPRQATQGSTFDAIIKKNAENKARMEKDKAKANKSVLRSYRIKH